jgi:hypothetical protein
MEFMHEREYLKRGDIVVVDCSHRCNVRLMTDSDFQSFRGGKSHRYYGGHYDRLPARIVVPDDGWWNVTLDWAAVAQPLGIAFDS